MNKPLVDRARDDRGSGAVLKTRLSNIRSRSRDIPIFVYEGSTDVGPYEVWITQIRIDLQYEPLPGKGKSQVLDLRKRLQRDTGGLGAHVYFFIDRDFDDLRGQPPGPDLFCTMTHSIENNLVANEVLISILTDEFHCTAENETRDRICALFATTIAKFEQCMTAPNRRLYRACRAGIPAIIASESLPRYVNVSLNDVTEVVTPDRLSTLIRLEREPSDQESQIADAEFDLLEPRIRHRGKFLLGFFLRWLQLLVEEAARPEQTLFVAVPATANAAIQKLTPRRLAASARPPMNLPEFILNVTATPAQ